MAHFPMIPASNDVICLVTAVTVLVIFQASFGT